MRNENNERLQGYNQGEEYSETICFNFNKKTDEFENSTDLYVTKSVIDFSTENLTDEQIDEVQNYADGVQNEISEWLFMVADIEQTEMSLCFN